MGKQLTPNQIAQLKACDFVWDLRDEIWSDTYKVIKDSFDQNDGKISTDNFDLAAQGWMIKQCVSCHDRN